ncbi:MAG: phosphotransferase family protein [Pyrinomonadaceae bacterium]|nr:phosphotransferase family protein [Pyrinomonadaceae bacterium]MBP9108701.1 phosphotransferase family protein [Pyrinomonadaceae bacterium]
MAETSAVRPGEEIDVERLSAFLGEELDLPTGEIGVEQFPAGSSNLTYLVRLGRATCESPRVSKGDTLTAATDAREYVLRRPPFGNTVKSAHDMQREFDVLSKLSAIYTPAPKPLIFSRDVSIIGSEFYLMERRSGLIIRGKIPGTYETLISSQDSRLDVCRSFIQNLADLHRLDYKAAGLESLGRADGYNRRQVEGWTKRYFAAKTDTWDDLEKAITWLNDNIPTESGASLIHNDYKFDNVMLDPTDLTKITAVLDWEMVTIGDPLMDLGTTLGYWMSKDVGDELLNMPFNPRVLMENITRQQLVEMYSESLGRKIPDMLFYYVFGTFKIAVIAQQIYARYVKGFTRDMRFANFDKFVAALGKIAASAIARDSI